MWDRIRDLFERYGSLALPAKLLLNALIVLLAGPGLLGFLSEYATYNFAFHENTRWPLEGIPFLRMTVMMLSLFMGIMLAFGFVMFLGFAKLLSWGLRKTYATILEPYEIMAARFSAIFPILRSLEGLSDPNKLQSLSRRQILIVSTIAGVCTGSFVYLFALASSQDDSKYPMSRFGVAFMMGVFIFLVIILLWIRGSAWWLAAFLSLAYAVIGLWILLDVDKYGEFLRQTRYGGGIETIVEITEAGQNVKFAAYLVLRTSSALLLFDPSSNVIREISIENVRSIIHPAATLDKISYRLPSGAFGLESSVGRAARPRSALESPASGRQP